MCESTVYLLEGDKKVKVLEEAARVTVTGDGVVVVSLTGERRSLDGVVVSDADLMRHEIILTRRKG